MNPRPPFNLTPILTLLVLATLLLVACQGEAAPAPAPSAGCMRDSIP